MQVPASLLALILFLGSVLSVVALNEKTSRSINKTKWPELVGRQSREAVDILKQELPGGALVQVLPEGAMVTMDFRLDRVRVFVSEEDRVSSPPMIG